MRLRSIPGMARPKGFADFQVMGLDDDERAELAGVVKSMEISRGSVIMREGEVGDSMYFLARGVVEVTQRLTLKTDGQGLGKADKSVVKLSAEHVPFFGDMALFEDEPRSATITASTDCLIFQISRPDFEGLCRRNPALGIRIVSRIAAVLCQRLRRSNQDVLKLTTALSLALSR